MKKFSDVPIESTRERILVAAQEEMYEHGFQGLRIDAVLKRTQLAKGALYHYFPNKLALGYAIVDECIMGFFYENWDGLLTESKDPLQAVRDFFRKQCEEILQGECANGCPLTNLIQEMSTLDEGFQQRLRGLMMDIIEVVATGLAQGQADGLVRTDKDPRRVAAFIFSCYQGIMSSAKCMQSMESAVDLFDTFGEYLDSLRPSQSRT